MQTAGKGKRTRGRFYINNTAVILCDVYTAVVSLTALTPLGIRDNCLPRHGPASRDRAQSRIASIVGAIGRTWVLRIEA